MIKKLFPSTSSNIKGSLSSVGKLVYHPLYFFVIVFFLGTFTTIEAQKNIFQVFRSYKNDPGVQSYRFTDKSLKKWLGQEKELKSYIENAEVIIFGKDVDINMKDKNIINMLLQQNNYELLTEMKDKDSKVVLYIKEEELIISNVYAALTDSETKIYLIFKGSLKPDELTQLGLNFNDSNMQNIFGQWKK